MEEKGEEREKKKGQSLVVVHTCDAVFRSLRQEDLEFEVSLSFIERSCFKKKKKKSGGV
jgi:hypothetical protein